ncbi:putative enzyme related to lactoylglutathione lyase [Agromyces sp. 3263]|uniref:VOC family protein n=1 Tax=Agromyces sp. 3263 TaxID=2817750 RepID=UPI00285B4D55|nr:VOC family protein [Agromyces sp. 3263]MDR6907075.1 putative enzyme related to lactoylglutathione lyase [Agromyces sp. 3263]
MQRTYPEGVPSWIDLEAPDLDEAQRFYGGLFGWTFEAAPGPRGDAAYVVAHLDGRAAAGLGAAAAEAPAVDPPTWNTYVAVADLDAAVARVAGAGGHVIDGPADVGRAGRAAGVVDPAGARFRLWQAGARAGVQVVNEPGAWNFSDLHTSAPHEPGFYEDVFGWEFADLGFATLIRCPGYGDHLAATVDPDIRQRQASAITPPRFEDAIGWLAPSHDGEPPHWHVTFTVADRDEVASTAERLGATVLASTDTHWTQEALIRDPQGGVFTASRFVPPEQ